MSGRKRSNPQRIDVENDAKRRELCFYQFLPRERPSTLPESQSHGFQLPTHDTSHALQPLSDLENSSGTPQIIGTTELKPAQPRRRKKRKRKAQKVSAVSVSKPKPQLPQEIVDSLTLAPPPDNGQCCVPILHQWMIKNTDVEKIQSVHQGLRKDGALLFAKIQVEIIHGVPLAAIFNSCDSAVRLSLFCSQLFELLKVEVGDGVFFVAAKMNPALKSALMSYPYLSSRSNLAKMFLATNDGEDPLVKCLELELWVTERLCELGGASEPIKQSVPIVYVNSLVKTIYPNVLPEKNRNACAHKPTSHYLTVVAKINDFYKQVQLKRRELSGADNPYDASTIVGLTAELRGYQCKALQWMVEREKGGELEMKLKDELHMLWSELPTMEYGLSHPVYFNPTTGKFSLTHFLPEPLPRGGILADEMGLGKTVEILALIMAHTWPGHCSQDDSQSDSNNQSDSKSLDNTDQLCEPGITVRDEPMVTDTQAAVKRSSSPKKIASMDESCVDDRVQCLCGAVREADYDGEFVQCERCLVWQHSQCVNFISEKHNDKFVCIQCLLEKPLPSKTTLIISPQSIAQQWIDEIHKHTLPGALKVLMYKGVSLEYLSPFELSTYDVVLVSYETLRTEFYHANNLAVSRKLRHSKRYNCYPSPLPAVQWWRVCLDEAQMVENTNLKAAEMTMKLSAINRWCVTGTPVQRDLLDLYGLVLFLGVDPYNELCWFNNLVWHPFIAGCEEPMISLFSSIMWRNSKADVADELCLPDNCEEIHWLWFSSVEAYFYRKQQEVCFNDLMKVLTGLPEDDITLSSLLQSTVNKLMNPLHSLRQACCHPQIVKSGYLHLPGLWNRRKGRRAISGHHDDNVPFTVSNRNCMSMSDLLDKLIMQAKVEAREALRQLVASLNGLAAVHILKEEWSTAVDAYREAMTSWQEHLTHEVECDKLQRIHTMENLAELLDMGHGNGTSTLRDDSLKKEACTLRSKYMEKAEGQVKAAAEAMLVCKNNIVTARLEANWVQADYLDEVPLQDVLQDKNSGQTTQIDQHCPDDDQTDSGSSSEKTTSEEGGNKSSVLQDRQSSSQDKDKERVEDLARSVQPMNESTSASEKRKPVYPSEPWWLSVSQWCSDLKLSSELLDAINAEMEVEQDPFTVSLRIHNTDGLDFLLCSNMDRIELAREVALSHLEKLVDPPSAELVEQAAACHLQNRFNQDDDMLFENEKKWCDCCTAEQKIVNYQHLIFARFRGLEEGTLILDHGDGLRGMSAFERILRSMLTFARHKGAPQKLLDAGWALINHIEVMKKEYTALRTLWMATEHRVCVCDELKMAATRLRFMTTVEMHFDRDIPSAIHPVEVVAHEAQHNDEKRDAKTSLKKCLGQVLYLKNLAKVKDQNSENTELCPICTSQLGVEWGVFTCGHSVCLECIVTLIKRQVAWSYRPMVMVRCPLCREPTLSTEINYVKINATPADCIPVQGSHSTKVIAVTRKLIDIQRSDPGAKSLVFSSWMEILELISRSLIDNNIRFKFLKTKKSFQANLTEFKSSSDVNVLLIPFHSGSKGLNIVEASHVLLVEPLLNVGVELQAIGRVHRMGQTKPTKVHRFYVKNTVEEKVFQLLTNQSDRFTSKKESESVLTIRDIKNLFTE